MNPTPALPADVYAQLGQITRQLHDAVQQLGLVPQLRNVADQLPDTRSRLEYVAQKTGQAAEKVLNLVDDAKLEREQLSRTLRELVTLPATSAQGDALTAEAQQRLQRIDSMLTDIMLAQDFHDLTGQVMRRGIQLVTQIEANLVQLLMQAAPPGSVDPAAALQPAADEATAPLSGPATDGKHRSDVVTNQTEVDDLLASLGF